jgi:hypothetical protein
MWFLLLLLGDEGTVIDQAEVQGWDLPFVLIVRLRHFEKRVIRVYFHAHH